MSKTLRDARNLIEGTLTAEIQLMLSSPSLSGKVLITVEGADDKKAYSKLFDDNYTFVHPVGGCAQYDVIFSNVGNKYSDRLIALKDADFGHLNDNIVHEDNLFITDGHDIEMMMADNEFEKDLQREFLDGKTIPIIDIVVEDIRHLSYIKWINDISKYNLNVKSIKPSKEVYDGNSEITISDCLQQLYRCNSNSDRYRLSENEVISFENDNHMDDYFNLTNGHDLFEGICRKIYFEKATDKYSDGFKPQSEEISRMARTAYTIDKFSKTTMYKEIKRWEDNKGKRILKGGK